MVTIAEMNHRIWHNFSRAGEVVNENHHEHHKAAQSIYRLDSVQYNAWLVGGCSVGHYFQCSVFPAALAILIISRAAKTGRGSQFQIPSDFNKEQTPDRPGGGSSAIL
jgi:hypothetical protein